MKRTICILLIIMLLATAFSATAGAIDVSA